MTKVAEPTKVVFFGTSDRSLPILDSLKANFDLVLCVTKSDTKVGRKRTKKETGVKVWARKNEVNYIEIDSLKSENLEEVIEEIKKSKADYGVVADFSFIIPKKIIETLKRQIINIHFSLLPKYRGASPVQFAILNGDDKTGITFHILDEKMDNGDIIKQVEYKMTSKETSGELYDTLFKIASQELPKVLQDFTQGRVIPLPQDKKNITYTLSKTHSKNTFIFKEDALINWDDNPKKIEKMIRAFNPWPIAWTYLKDMEKAKHLHGNVNLKNHINKNLKVKIHKSKISDGKLEIEELQIEGKNKMKWKDFVNGYLDLSRLS